MMYFYLSTWGILIAKNWGKLISSYIQTTFVGGEPFYKPVIDGKDQELVLRKLMKLVAEL